MAKEVISGDVVEVLEDEGPEEGEIEDDTSDEDNVTNYRLCSSNATQVNATIGAKYFQPPSSSSNEVHSLKPQAHAEEKTEKSWGNTSRRRYKFYVDHDNPSRETYDRLKKSDINSDHRGLNFHDLLSEYKTSKHGNEGNTHEKENRHYPKEVRLDTSRKRENVVNDLLVDKVKRSKKRKHRRSPSRSPVSSEPEVSRKKKEIRTNRPRRKKKLTANIRNSKESAQIFAQIRASKLNLGSFEQKKSSVEVINVVSEGENQTEVSELALNTSKPFHSEGEGNQLEKNDSETNGREGECLSKEPIHYNSNKGSFSASDSQTAEKIEDSESKDEDDDVHQLRMIALQSAFRAKYLARKRLGLIKKHSNKTGSKVNVDRGKVDSILDDTAELLEAAEEESISTSIKDPESNNLCTSLSEVPLPPDEPQNLPNAGITLAEDLTPVDMELALTDEEDNSTEQGKDDDCDVEFEDDGLHSKVRISRNLTKTRNIPVTIGRNQHYKARQRSSINDQENSRRNNLLEVRTSGEVNLVNLDSGCVSMEDLNMCSMVIHDPLGTNYSTESCHVLDEDHTLSEASDAKSDSIYAYSGQFPILDNEDEDEELLRAKLLLDISSRHRKEEAMIKSALALQDLKTVKMTTEKLTTPFLVQRVQPECTMLNSEIKINGKSSGASVVAISQEKMKAKKTVEKVRRGQLLQKTRVLKSAHAKQFPITTFVRGRASKISNRGKYQRVNQVRMAMNKKRIDGNIQVTVPVSNSKSKVINKIPQQQDRIVICLGEDSDDSDDEKQKLYLQAEPQMDDTCHIMEIPEGGYNKMNAMEIAFHRMTDPKLKPNVTLVRPESGETQTICPRSGPSIPVGSVPVDFEKSVDLFLKEVRSVQELKSKISQTSGTTSVKAKIPPAQDVKKTKVAVNTPQAAKTNLKSLSGITPQAVRHLPFPQQEEYRRLKMQISILEMQKKRKAEETSQAPPKSEQKAVSVISVPVLKLDQTTSKEAANESRNDDNESSHLPSLPSDVSSKDLTTQEKPADKVSNERITTAIDAEICDDIDDENVMREQLLRSRLRKRAAALAEIPSLKRECMMLSAKSDNEVAVLSTQISTGETSLSMELTESCKSPDKIQHESGSDGGREAVSSTENDASSVKEVVLPETEASKGCKGTAKSDEIPPTLKAVPLKAEFGKVESGNALSNIKLVDEKKILEKKPVSDTKEDVAKNVTPVVLSAVKVNGMEAKTEKGLSLATSASGGITGTTKIVNVQSMVPSNGESQESKESQLKDLESQLLSERHAALEYLRELSRLLNTMELEGNRLKEKEAAVKKLKAELSLAEVSLHTQKRLMKQLAFNVSTTHAYVTETRHKCTLLSRACLKLGNQIKQEEVANGGEKTIYKVPTGVAELVKNHLSSVLCHTKQLKKSGLPFLGLSQEFINKDSYAVKKAGKRFVAVHTQPHPMQWAKKHPVLCNKPNLKIEKNFTPSVFVKSVKNNSSVVKSYADIMPTRNLEPVKNISTSIASILPVSKVLMTGAKSSACPKNSSDIIASSTALNQTSTKEVHVPDSNTNVVATGSSFSTEEDVASCSRTIDCPSLLTLRPPDSSKTSEKAVQLRDYDSPLESVSRTSSEKLTGNVSSDSQNVQPEENMVLDPNIMLCPYDLMGVCQDEECSYQHQRRGAAVKKS